MKYNNATLLHINLTKNIVMEKQSKLKQPGKTLSRSKKDKIFGGGTPIKKGDIQRPKRK